MSSSSVSFRISRHTQDLAETVHALSQRLVAMEERLLSLEEALQAVRQQPSRTEEAESASLAPIEASIERLLQDCRQLLAEQPAGSDASDVAAGTTQPSPAVDSDDPQPSESGGVDGVTPLARIPASPRQSEDVEALDADAAASLTAA